jgi:predicted RNase H-like nuclease
MPAILAIDAAWTAKQPSGVAAVAKNSSGWQCMAVAPNYEHFFKQASTKNSNWPSSRLAGSSPDVPQLLKAAQQITGMPIDLITVDMPLSTISFTSRREADNAISREFGGRWCSAHTPNVNRPGKLGAQLSTDFKTAGYPLATAVSPKRSIPCLIEVYPHPALLSLLKRPRRFPYKVAKSRKYWPDLDVCERIKTLLAEFREIHSALSRSFDKLPFDLPHPSQVRCLSHLKPYEDALDSLICAWVGIEYLNGGAVPLGDDTAAIWCPKDVVFNYGVR